MADYIINYRNGGANANVTLVPGGTAVLAGMNLMGQNFANYGTNLNQNWVSIAENWASNTTIANPVTGQLWYNNGNLQLNTGSQTSPSWQNVTVSGSGSNITFGNITVSGNLITTNITTGGNTIPGTITGNWALTAGSKIEATYADLAEYYSGDTHIEPGTVVEFGGSREVTVCNTDASTRVAGVVSTQPAYVMNKEIATEYVVCVALQGRVPCGVVGPVRKGDMLVSAGNGAARSESNPTIGSVIGKSLVDKLTDDYSVIEVAVGRL